MNPTSGCLAGKVTDWNFILFQGSARDVLGEFFTQVYLVLLSENYKNMP